MFSANRKFLLFFIGRAIDLAGSAMTPVVLTLAVLQATNSVSDTGVVLAANVLPTLILMMLGGVVADRIPRARILIITCVLSALVQLAMAAALFAHNFSLILMAILAACSGAISAFSSPALRGIVPDLVDEDHIQNANAALATAKNASKILGPTIAGVLVAFAGGGMALIIDAITFILAAACFSRLPGQTSAKRRQDGMLKQLFEGFAAFRRLRWVWTLSLCYAMINLLMIGPWQVVSPDLIRQDHNVAVWGVILSVRAAGLLCASIILLKLRFKNPLVAGLVFGSMSALPLLAIGISAPIGAIFVVVFVSSFGITAAGVTYDSALQSRVPRSELSRVASIDDLLSFATVPLSQALVGPVSQLVGARGLLVICGVAVIVLHFIPLLVRDVRTVTKKAAID